MFGCWIEIYWCSSPTLMKFLRPTFCKQQCYRSMRDETPIPQDVRVRPRGVTDSLTALPKAAVAFGCALRGCQANVAELTGCQPRQGAALF